MEATRTRFGFLADWLTAGALLVGTVIVAALVVRELRMAQRPLLPDDAHRASSDVATSAAAVPAEAVSVPTLTLGANVIRVGDRMPDALSLLATPAQPPRLTRQTTERGPLGPREIRWYQLSGTSFILVFEPFERRGEPRVAAIYVI